MAASVISRNSILKSPGTSRRPVPQKVRFQMADRVKTVLVDFINGSNVKPYEELVLRIRESNFEDDELTSLLLEVRECIVLINKDLHHLVESILALPWIYRDGQVVVEYQAFLIDLGSAHNYYISAVMDMLVRNFMSKSNTEEWDGGTPLELDVRAYKNLHNVLRLLLRIVPMSQEILMECVNSNHFPYYKRSAHDHECFVYNMLEVVSYNPQIRLSFFLLLMNRLVELDVHAPRSEIQAAEEEEENVEMEMEIFSMDQNEVPNCQDAKKSDVMKHQVANTLDILMKLLFKYFQTECFDESEGTPVFNWDRTRCLYQCLISVFEQVILPTHDTHHVQFLLFYLCSLRPCLAESFLNFLWNKVRSPNTPVVIRRASVEYIASFLARAVYIPLGLVKSLILEMAQWIHSYISNQDDSSSIDVRSHVVFYSVCQCLFYIIAFRHKDLVNTRKNLIFLQNLNLTKVITCRLNPLRICLPAVVQNFAAVTRTYQLAYCYTIIEHNARNRIPIVYLNDKGAIISQTAGFVEAYFPFDPFLLLRSGRMIKPLYREYQASEVDTDKADASTTRSAQREEEDDDFLTEHPIANMTTSPSSCQDMFSYGSSPGFIQG